MTGLGSPRPLAGLALALLLSACGGAAAPASAPASTTAASPNPASASAKPAASGSAGASAAAKPAASGSAAASAAAGAGTHVELVNSSLSGDSIPVWVAKETGIFQKNGLDLNIQLINGAAAAVATLVAGKVDFGNLGGSAVLTSSAGGADLVILGSASPVVPYRLYTPPDVKTPADLKGKKVDLGTIGSAPDVATHQAIKQLGLSDSDVTYVTTGSHEAATTALLNGAIQGRVDNPPGSVELDARGFNVLLDMAAQKIPAANSTIVVSRAYLGGHKDLAQAYIDSIVQGTARARADKAATVNALKKYYKSDDTRAMEAAYDFWVGEVIPPLPFARPEQFAQTQQDMAKDNPKVKDLDVAKLIDSSFVQSAASRGLDKA